MSQSRTKGGFLLDDLWHCSTCVWELTCESVFRSVSPLRRQDRRETSSPTDTVSRDRADGTKLCVWRYSASWTGFISSGGLNVCAGAAAEHVKLRCSWCLSRCPNTPTGSSFLRVPALLSAKRTLPRRPRTCLRVYPPIKPSTC